MQQYIFKFTLQGNWHSKCWNLNLDIYESCYTYNINKRIFFFFFVFNFWRTKISSYKFWNNILFSLIFSYQKKNVKIVILSPVPPKKKKTVILTTHFYLNVWFLYVFVIYLNSNTSIIFIKIYIYNYFFPKKKSLPHLKSKNYSFLSQNFYGFFL